MATVKFNQDMPVGESYHGAKLGDLRDVTEEQADDLVNRGLATRADNEAREQREQAAATAVAEPPNYNTMTVKELHDLAAERGLPVSGTHAELVKRHKDHDKGKG